MGPFLLNQYSARRCPPRSRSISVMKLSDKNSMYRSMGTTPPNQYSARHYLPRSSGREVVNLSDQKGRYRSMGHTPPNQYSTMHCPPSSRGREVLKLSYQESTYRSMRPTPPNQYSARRRPASSLRREVVKLIDDKMLYRSFGSSPPNQNTDMRCLPISPCIEVREVLTLSEDLVGIIISYCDNVTLEIFWSEIKSMRLLVLKAMSLLLGVFDERARVLHTLSFLQIRMLVIINMFIITHEEMFKHNVRMQRLYKENQLARNHYSIFLWEEYLSDDEAKDFEEDGSKNLVTTVPIDYVSLVFVFFLRWTLMSKEQHILCACNRVFNWDHGISRLTRGSTTRFVGEG